MAGVSAGQQHDGETGDTLHRVWDLAEGIHALMEGGAGKFDKPMGERQGVEPLGEGTFEFEKFSRRGVDTATMTA